jgi:flavin-dependent dehydrogenase
VVGADGMRSRVARQAGAWTLRGKGPGAANIYAYWSGLPSDTIENHFGADGEVVGVIPTNDGQACVWVAFTPEEFRTSAAGDLAGAYHRKISANPLLAEVLAPAMCEGGYRGFPGAPGHLRQGFGAGWALVGDAGYFKDPVSTHGITDAFIGAEFLAEALVDIIDGGADEVEALGHFQTLRDDLAAMLMPPVARLARLDLDPAGAMTAFKQMNKAWHHEYELLTARAAAETQAQVAA